MAVTAPSTDQLLKDYDHDDHDFILGISKDNDTTPPPAAAPSSSTPAAPRPSTGGGLFSRRPSLFGGSSKSKASKLHKHSLSQALTTNSHNTNTNTNTPSSSTTSRTVSPPTIYLPPPSPASSNSTTATDASRAPGQYELPSKVPATPHHHRKHPSRHSISSSVADIGSQLRRSRSASLRTNNSSNSTTNGTPPRPSASSHKRTPSYTLALSFSPEKNPPQNAPPAASRPALSISTFSRSKQKSSESVKADAVYEKSPLSAVDKPKTPFGMAVPLRHPPSQKEIQLARQNTATSFNGGLAPAAPIALPSGTNPNIIFQHIQEMASKRISTLDYLRKAHEGRIYWFNTLLFSKNDLTRLPSFSPRNLNRRATQYLLLGFSLPTILDLNANSPSDYLKALNALLVEFEQYQSIHPADGSAPSSLSRARIPQMFKRVNVGGKGRRSSSAAGDFPLLTPQNSFNEPASAVDSPPTDDVLLPNESYTYLQTPSLPFDPDFFSTFATLCDVLIDCYTKILSLLSTPESVAAAGGGAPSMVGELFNKADAKVRKIILAGVVREFEESCRQGVRGEVGGVGKVVLGGLM